MAKSPGTRTKLKIKEAFLECLDATDYAKITVSQITQAAHVSRKTFYYHFSDKNDLAKWICIHDMDSTASRITDDGPAAFCELVRFFIDQNRILYGNALQDMSLGSFGQFYSDILFYQISARLRAFYLDRFESRSVTNLALSQKVEQGRLLTIIWLLHPAKPSADDLMNYLYQSELVHVKTVGRWLDKPSTIESFANKPPFNPTADDFAANMTHAFSVRDSFERALSNAESKRIAEERYTVEMMMQRYR
ncbi:TetR family transcriptional regulator [Adlercreutzia sp. R21]|uniref:TetR/AcrR family transcriptional regulator n=1 Tax=Adlercreutzia wanghongyangiae TaxID=3111451 RepID=UPI002DBD0503|nr:TetR family transcriptional regulator [Adlercreutzia sp. R21]MEC4183271.1 TetR family transcriptional regulator [Adlercreutzia sp. R21]